MRKAITNPSLQQLLDSVPTKRGARTRAKCSEYIEKGGSVFGILRMDHQSLEETFGVAGDDVQALRDKAASLALYAARQFREQRLVRQGPENPLHRSGARAVMEMPNFNDLFGPKWEGASPPNTMSANNFAVAYFVHLITLARDLEARAAGGAGLVTLDTRRPDLANMVIDAKATFQVKPTVKLFNEILENIIEAYLAPALEDNNQVVDDVLRVTRFPPGRCRSSGTRSNIPGCWTRTGYCWAMSFAPSTLPHRTSSSLACAGRCRIMRCSCRANSGRNSSNC